MKGRRVIGAVLAIGLSLAAAPAWAEDETDAPGAKASSDKSSSTLGVTNFMVPPASRKADVAVVFIESPLSNPYSVDDREKGGNGYLPLTLQYRPYTARTARQRSIASGDFRESADRGYRDKTNRAVNASDLNAVLQARADMEEKPVIVVVRMHNPAVLAEFEPYVDAIIVDFGVEQDAVWELLTGAFAPSGLLPLALPTDMEAVEAHCEDLPFDYEPYADTEGNAYDFGYGMSFGGVIDDDRTHRYTMKRGGE